MSQIIPEQEERINGSLRELYRRYGYRQYRMSKFEEYDLYARNKDFLISDHIITFTDLNGRLMALKPDVTLSIVRNCAAPADGVRKVYYHENVYRVPRRSGTFREIPQAGIECIGALDDYYIAETLLLAAESLCLISERCVLDVSHLGILSDAIDALGITGAGKSEVLKFVGEKNLHELSAFCTEAGADAEAAARLLALAETGGTPETVLPRLRALGCREDYVAQLEAVAERLDLCGRGGLLRIDFSAVNDMRYYNGIVFRGYVDGIPDRVLSGGQYDSLLRKMGRRDSAVGFAVYLDMLERFYAPVEEPDTDVVLLYDEATDRTALALTVQRLTADGQRVDVCRSVPEKLSYLKLMKMNGSEVETIG